MESTETRRVGKHLFIFEKGKQVNASDKSSRTLIASCVGTDDENLPREFINYTRTLFSILDERRTGFVKLSDIEARWGRKNGQLGNQPVGVLESLRKVTPPHGLLSFETLCLGFRLALRPSEGEVHNLKQLTVQEALDKNRCELICTEKNEPGALETEGDEQRQEDDPVVVQRLHRRPRSMVQLGQQKELLDLSVAKRRGGILEGIGKKADKKAVVDKLREWRNHELRKGINNIVQQPERVGTNSYGNTKTSCRRQTAAQEGKEIGSDSEHRLSRHHSPNKESRGRIAKPAKVRVYYQGEKTNGKGLNGGSPDNTATPQTGGKVIISKGAKLKSLEEELTVLGDGLGTVEKVRDWLFTRITAVQEEKLYVNGVKKYSPQDYEASVHGSRRQELGLNPSNFRNFARHIEELKMHLDRVVQKPLESLLRRESSELENKRRIAQLENEKRALIRELFQCKSQQDNPTISGLYIHTRKK